MDITKTLCCVTYVTLLALECHARYHPKQVTQEQKTTNNCVYNNHTYRAGGKFQPDSCTFCHCPRTGGRPKCVIEDCRYEPDCVRYEKSSQSDCCEICIEKGCMDSEGSVHRPGDLVSVTSCTECRCPPGGGRIVCSHVTCADTNCVDPVTMPGACCPICPNGPNCWLGREILPADRVVKRGSCKTCQCPTQQLPVWLKKKGAKALCTIRC